VVDLIKHSKLNGTLRCLVETAAATDPILADALYIIDNTVDLSAPIRDRDIADVTASADVSGSGRLFITNWHSYGRPAIRDFEVRSQSVKSPKKQAVILPCALTRPYHKSRLHKKIYSRLSAKRIRLSQSHRIVITSIGIVPEELWADPIVCSYDAGVPDIYRLLRLARSFFSTHSYDKVTDCLSFEPYSDILRILHAEGHFRELVRVSTVARRPFYVRAAVLRI
jgi:predicted RNA-binding protein